MVFTKLSVHEKDAFFGLLDEYFQSRPELFGQSGGSQGAGGFAGTGIPTAAAASVVQRAFAANAPGSSGGASGMSGKSNNPYAATMTSHLNNVDVGRAVSAGRVAAASLAFSQAGGPASSQPHSQSASHSASPSPSLFSQIHSLKPPVAAAGDGPPSLPRRAVSAEVVPGAEVDKLVTRKTSVFSALKKSPTPAVTIPSAFVAAKNTFGPPPVRRTTSETNTDASTTSTSASTTLSQRGNASRGVGATVGTRRVPPASEEVAEGEWAEVLYDYSSEDPGDLAIEAGTRVFVTAKSSDDWWTGQVEGQEREGLFPASYVKLL